MRKVFYLILIALVVAPYPGNAQQSSDPYGHNITIEPPPPPCYCPDFTLYMTPSSDLPIITCVGDTLSFCLGRQTIYGQCGGSLLYYGDQNVETAWRVYNVTAAPQQGKGGCATFTVLTPGEGLLRFQVTASLRYPGCYKTDTATQVIKVYATDLDIDSDNDNGFDRPLGTAAEDSMEDDTTMPGKIIAVNNGDEDSDGVPNFVDGFDFYGNEGVKAGGKFVPLIVNLPAPIDPARDKIRFTYSASDPRFARISGAGTPSDPYRYEPADGNLRIWTVDGNVSRNKNDPKTGGHFIRPGVDYTISSLPGDRQITLYVEAVSPSQTIADQAISVEIYPAGASRWMCGDQVRLTAFQIDTGFDVDRDRIIDYADRDVTSTNAPYRFWLNNDRDTGDDDEADDLDPTEGAIDSDDARIACLRDLEDFSPISIRITGPSLIYELFESRDLTLYLTQDISDGAPSVRFFKAVNQNSPFDYLDRETTAQSQKKLPRVGVWETATTFRPPNALMDLLELGQIPTPGSPSMSMLFEGLVAGSGSFSVRPFLNAHPLSQSSAAHFQLRDIKQMYEHYTVGDVTDIEVDAIPNEATEINNFTYPPDAPETMDYVLFVHGWRMRPWERRSFAETAYKRLFWAKYNGRFGLFSWPTDYTGYPEFHQWNYDISEERAWWSAAGLHNLLHDLSKKYTGHIRLYAHSMGNIVASEALRYAINLSNQTSHIVYSYTASQAASVSHAYCGGTNFVETGLTTQTPEVYGKFPPTGYEYFRGISTVTDKILNLFNGQDYALNWWLLNQDMKPRLGYYYEFVGFDFTEKHWTYDPTGISPTILDFPQDTYRIYAYIAEARSRALGAEGNTSGEVSTPFDLGVAPTQFADKDYEHSGQFRSTAYRRLSYWQRFRELNQIQNP